VNQQSSILALKQNLIFAQDPSNMLDTDFGNTNYILKRIDYPQLISWCFPKYRYLIRLGLDSTIASVCKGGVALVTRALRLGIHASCPVKNGTLLIAVRNRICNFNPFNNTVNVIFSLLDHSRVLFLCRIKNDTIFFGEYSGNPDRRPVHIYKSIDGMKAFDIEYSFKSGTVRHIHGVFFDPYENKIWVTTGDTDEESGIWVTNDQFRTIERVAGGTQQVRTIQLLFSERWIYFGSDAPLERNFVYRMDRNSGQVEKLQEVESPIFWGCKVGDYLFFSTVVEPTSINKTQYACIWGSPNGEKWKCIAKFKKDIWPMKLFQYGQIFFPAGENRTGKLWFTPWATQNHMMSQSIDIADIDWGS
jgi:hypothetical protein